MRWLIAVLLVANLVLALWSGLHRGGGTGRDPEPDFGSLYLLPPPEPDIPYAPDARIVAVAGDAPPAESGDAARAVAPPPTERRGTETASAAADAGGGDDPPPEPQGPQPETLVRPAARPAVCWSLGPFEERDLLDRLRLPVGIERIDVRTQRIEVESGYYVLIPAAPDAETARRTAERLRRKGIRDSWIFPSGPLRNAISLGMFSQIDNARRREREVRRLGFEARVVPRRRRVDGHVLRVRGADLPVHRRLLEGLVPPGRLRRVPCP